MSLLAIELGSLDPEPYTAIIRRILENIDSSYVYIVIYSTPDLHPKLNSPAKRAGRFQQLQKLISAFYVCTAIKMETACDIVFADWCGYSLEDEIWEYSVLNFPECNTCLPEVLTEASPNIIARLPRSTTSVRKVPYLSSFGAASTSADIVGTENDHPVVAGHKPFRRLIVVGGTFDHLHPGHKILLSIAAYLASRKLICGITGSHNINSAEERRRTA